MAPFSSARALLVLASVWLCGCVASARFHATSGQSFAPVASRAVVCSAANADVVRAAGGFVIGTIAARGLTVTSTVDDVTDEAARIAARSGGTHVVLTEAGIDRFTTAQPGTTQRDCVRTDDGHACTTTYQPPTTTTYEKPTARFVVLRVPPSAWGQLGPELRPAPRT